jgi:hypothetical protein
MRMMMMIMMIGSGGFTEDRSKVFDASYKRPPLNTILNKFNKSTHKQRIFSPVHT